MAENSINATTEIEIPDPEIEAGPDAGGLVETTREGINSVIELADNIDRLIEAQNKIRAAVMKLAQPGDWVLFGKEGEGGKAEIGFAGAMRIASVLGISFMNWEARKEIDRDEIGEKYRWEYECDAAYRGRVVRVYGRASSRDKFFAKAKGEWRPLHEIDEGNIKMVARRSAMKEGTKVLFGLHHMDPEYIKKFGVKLDNAAGHAFKSETQQVAETQSVTIIIEEAKLFKEGKRANGQVWRLYEVKSAEGDRFVTFSDTVYASALSAKQEAKQATVSYKLTDKGGKEITALTV